MFVYSLPLFFYRIEALTPLEFLLLALMIGGLLWVSAPEPTAGIAVTEDKGGFRHYLLQAWLGRMALWRMFWPFFLVLNLLLYVVDTLAISGEFTVSSWDDVYFVLFTPVVFWTLCVWRNSANCRFRIWAALARLMTLAVYFEYGLKLLIRMDYPRIFFNCHEFLFDYAVCF
ncbi:hypothetical protein Q9L42_000955 [Methylomarinum sp. Ch1-1]|uniref:Uncharacterized protein n=1 Tax=Methylomarinum roseum TaxID=3067653 RepID=A0AAU7NUQ7_9GAMM|nr:hypothetical protein [Methylomarinum sp. Ch1-1]MDP4519179.1 hypothetical protein [Methylomarinum sp. Ch1-1]